MIVAFYSQATGWIRQIGILNPNERPRDPLPGEGIMQISDTFEPFLLQFAQHGQGDLDPVQEFVNQQLGVQPLNTDYAIVNQGIVLGLHGKLDIALGDVNRALIGYPASSIAVPTSGAVVALGASYDGQRFINPIEQVVVKGAGVGT